ncbi:uncharacterized protein LOC143768157 [Ranitomeya variabilis]|uniref:uncharacterized protein LOC143768157 n=1 Tax=Ranitomeya variabilis TaxID=490064 RepID=UPI004056D17B
MSKHPSRDNKGPRMSQEHIPAITAPDRKDTWTPAAYQSRIANLPRRQMPGGPTDLHHTVGRRTFKYYELGPLCTCYLVVVSARARPRSSCVRGCGPGQGGQAGDHTCAQGVKTFVKAAAHRAPPSVTLAGLYQRQRRLVLTNSWDLLLFTAEAGQDPPQLFILPLISGTWDLLVEMMENACTQGLVTKKLVDQIRNCHPKLPTLYLIPKIHKNHLDPPGRPIVADSSHPISTVCGIPVGQFLRAQRICSDDINFERQAMDLTRRFTERGYSKRMIKRGYLRAAKTSRNQLLYKDSSMAKAQDPPEQVRFISTYNNKWNELKEIVLKHWKVLQADSTLRHCLPDRPSFVAKRSSNLKDTLVHSHYERKKNKKNMGRFGFFPCGFCKGCFNHTKATKFCNFDGSKQYDIRQHLNCSSEGVIYHAQCPCGKVYIGMTTRELKYFAMVLSCCYLMKNGINRCVDLMKRIYIRNKEQLLLNSSVRLSMDLKARESAWRSKAIDIFSRSTPVVSQNTSLEIKDLMHKYRYTLQRKTKLWWNKTTLENYLEKKIVPRGLRIQLYPTYELGNKELIARWISAASRCSLEFIQILIENNTSSLLELDNELESISKTLAKEMTIDQFGKWSKDLETDALKWEDKISQEKSKKYLRDVEDYDSNKIFRWQLKGGISGPRKRFRTQSDRSSEVDSATSASDVETTRDSQSKGNERKKKFPDMFQKAQRNGRPADRYQVVNLSSRVLTEEQINVLQRGLTFSPSNNLDPFTSVKDTHLFARKLVLKKLHASKIEKDHILTTAEDEALEALISLEEENASTSSVRSFGGNYGERLYTRSSDEETGGSD